MAIFAALCTAGDFIFTLLPLILDRSGDLNLIKSDTDIAIESPQIPLLALTFIDIGCLD